MSNLLEILGRAMTVDTADIIWHWFNTIRLSEGDYESEQYNQLDKVIELMSRQNVKEAQEQLRLYLFENPSCIRGRLASGAIALQNTQLNEAIEEFNSVYMRQPSNTMALYAIGHCYERIGKEAQAVEFYQDCLKFKNYLQLPRQRLAAIYFKNGQLEKTVSEYEILRKEYPDDIVTLLGLGYLYLATGKFEKAIETFNTAILIHPDNFQDTDDRVDYLIQQEQLEDAKELLEELLEKEPDRPDLIIRYADVLSMLGATNEALSQYQRVVRLCPDFLEATIKLGTQYLQLQQDRLAAQQFNQAFEINDRVVEAYIGLATAQKLAGQERDALATLSLTAAIQPNSSLLLSYTASLHFKQYLSEVLYFSSEELDDPTKMVIEAHIGQIKANPQNPDLHYRLGILWMSIGNLTDAIKSFEIVLQINPTFSRARHKLAVCFFESDKPDKALELLGPPTVIDKETLELHYKTALLYCNKIRFASSLLNLENFMLSNLTDSNATVNVSLVLQNLGLLDRASAMWDALSDTAIKSGNHTK